MLSKMLWPPADRKFNQTLPMYCVSLNFLLPIDFPKLAFLLLLPWSLGNAILSGYQVWNLVLWPSLFHPFHTATRILMATLPFFYSCPYPNPWHLICGPLYYHILSIHSTHKFIMLIFQNHQFQIAWLKFYIPIMHVILYTYHNSLYKVNIQKFIK